MPTYSPSWFRSFRHASGQSAEVVVPLLLELTRATSVVDVGCGLGAWLEQFRRRGVQDYLGVDGDYVSQADLLIEWERFRAHNLSEPLRLDRRFELCLCLEVAEHLPAFAADTLVESLTGLAPVVCFSAAIPGQGGTHHVNEQWPDYWVERFAARGYHLIDALRYRLWNHPHVDYWYAQNAVLFANEEALERLPELQRERIRTPHESLALIHPHLFCRTAEALERTWDYRARRAMRAVWRWARALRPGSR